MSFRINILAKIFFTGAFAFFFACGDDNRRQEVVDDIRILGVKSSQSVFAVGSTGPANLEIYALAPSGKTPVFSAATDSGAQPSRNSVSLALAGAAAQTDLGSFVLYQQNATVALPGVSAGLVPANEKGDVVFRYSFQVTGGKEPLLGVGDLFWLRGSSAASVALVPPTITLNSPNSGADVEVGEDIKLSASISGGATEDVRVSWFVGGGEVVNFRAATTTWKPDEADRGKSLPVLVAVRGLTSRSLDLKWVVVNVK